MDHFMSYALSSFDFIVNLSMSLFAHGRSPQEPRLESA